MTDPSTTYAAGILPDSVVRDPRSSGDLLYISLQPNLSAEQLQQFLRNLSTAVETLVAGSDDDQLASAVVGFGPSFFQRGLTVTPIGFEHLPPVAQGEQLGFDIVVYVLYRAEWKMADFRRTLASIGRDVITQVTIHHGHQRADGRELGGFLDGLRNPKGDADRIAVSFVDRDRDPDEPTASAGGSYLVAMRITQDLNAWDQLPVGEQEAIIGRRRDDGSRLDRPTGTPVADEGAINAGCPFHSHIAKSGPRGEHNDPVRMFRRGIPFVDLMPNGTTEAGLLFVAFHGSIEQFRVISEEWIGNPDFPTPGTGSDALFARGLATITHTAFAFVPAPAEFIGAAFFAPDGHDDRCLGHIAIRKTLVDANGQPIRTEKGGFTFQLFDANNNPIGNPFTTDSTGRATSDPVPVGVTYTVREVHIRDGFDPPGDQTVTLDGHRVLLTFENRATAATPPYR